ncbi:HWE histidine kinase domain-containing protein [Bradyrhizobium cenepequi]
MGQAATDAVRNENASLSGELSVSRCEGSLELLVKELQHRMRNLLTVVQCFVTNTEANTAHDYRTALTARIAALAEAYALLGRAGDHRPTLAGLLEQSLRPHAMFSRDRIALVGPELTLEPHLALSLHIIFHELVTNASKYGALTTVAGAVQVTWESPAGPGGRALAIEWRERGGPRVDKPEHRGFGMHLIARALTGARVELDFAPEGLVCRIVIEPYQTLAANDVAG